MTNTTPKVFFAYPSRSPTLKEAIDGAVPELNQKGQVKIKTWEKCNIGGKFVIDTICDAIDEAELFFADLTGLNANVMFELGYAIACGKRIWLILDDTYTKEKDMFEQLKILTTVGYVSCCNSQDIVSGFYKDKPFADIEKTIFRAPIGPNLKPYSILYLKSQHENQAALYMSNLLQERFPEKIIVDAPNKPAVQSLADYGNLVFSCNGLVCHFTNPAREDAHVQTARHALLCGMAHGFDKPLFMLAEGEFPSPIDYRDYLKHYKTASEALGYLKEWLPRVEQNLKVDQEATAVRCLKTFISYSHEDEQKKKKLRTCLAVMERTGKIKLWDDSDITAGGKARQEDILKEVANSDMLLYLVSAASLASKNCNKELTEAVRVGRRVIPIILESCDWLNDRLSNFQVLPDKAKPINKWQPEDDGWQSVVDGIRKAIEEMQYQVDSLSGTSEKEQHTESAFQQDNVLMMFGRMEQAVERDSHAVKLDPSNADAYFNLGNTYHRNGDYDRAIEAFSRAIELKRDFAEAYTNRGLAHQNKGDYDHAIRDHNEAIDLNPNYAEAYFNRGGAYKSKYNYDHALTDFTKAIELNRNFAAAYNHRGVVYLERGDYDLALADYTKAIDLNPGFVAETYYNRGLTYHKKGDYDFALADYTKAIDLNPDFVAETYYNRGRVWLYLREWEKAKSDLINAEERGMNIIATFRDNYGSIGGFEQITGIQLPADIAAMLTPQQ